MFCKWNSAQSIVAPVEKVLDEPVAIGLFSMNAQGIVTRMAETPVYRWLGAKPRARSGTSRMRPR